MYDYALLKLAKDLVTENKCHYEAFGSWYIACNNKRLIYDGKDDLLKTQDYKKGDWVENKSMPFKEVIFSNFIEFIDYLKSRN